MTRAVFWNLLGTVAMVLTTLITVPIFLRYFGAERYGILATVWVALGYFSFLDFGMGQAIVSFLSRPEAQDRHVASRIFWTGVMLNVVIGLALGVVLVATMLAARSLGWFAATSINEELFLAIPWLLVMMPIALVYPVLVGTLDARLKFKTANINQVVGGILFQTLPLLAILVFKPTLNVAIAGSVLGRLLSAAVLLLCDARALALTAPTFDGALLRRLTSFGGWVAISSGASSLLDTADRLVIGSMLGGVAAAWYSIAYNTVTRIRALPLAFIRALFPRIAADATGSRHELNRTARVLTLMLVPTVTIAIPAVEPLFRLWIGDTASAASAPIARIMLVGLFVNCIAHVPVVALQAGGAPERVAKLHVWELPVFLAIMWVAIHQFGVLGAAYAWAGRLIVDAALLFRTADLGNLFRRDVLIGGMAPVASFLVVLLLPDRPILTVVLAISVVAGWLMIDDQAARRSGTELTLAGLASELRRWRAIRARSGADA